jgi:MFS family permease
MSFTNLSTDGYILFGTRLVRMFAYGFLSVVLVLYLAQLGLSEALIGLLLSLALIGDAAISLWMTTNADRFGRRRILIAGAGLMLFAAVLCPSAGLLAGSKSYAISGRGLLQHRGNSHFRRSLCSSPVCGTTGGPTLWLA